MTLFINFVLYQSGWLACVIGAAIGRPWLGAGIGLVLLAVHLAFCRNRWRHAQLIFVAGVLGMAFDTLQISSGVFQFSSGVLVRWLPPVWIPVLWMQFATLLPFCLRWLSQRYLLSCLLGLVGGPVAFYAGERLGAVVFLPPRALHYAALGGVWSVALPVMVWISDRLIMIRSANARQTYSNWSS